MPSTQTTIFDVGQPGASSLVTRFSAFKQRIEAQINSVEQGVVNWQAMDCPLMTMYTPVAPTQTAAGSTYVSWNACMFCNETVKGGFPQRAMHLFGNTKQYGGAGYASQTIPACRFFSIPYKHQVRDLLTKAMALVPPNMHEKKGWTRASQAFDRALDKGKATSGTAVNANPVCLPPQPEQAVETTANKDIFSRCESGLQKAAAEEFNKAIMEWLAETDTPAHALTYPSWHRLVGLARANLSVRAINLPCKQRF